MSSVHDAVRKNADRYVGWLTEACSFPSLAGNDEGLAGMAAWLENKSGELGAESERLTLDDAPDALLGRFGRGERTVLVYDHYDVQPVDPIDLWASPPFEPEIRDGAFYARGAADNKGDLVARLAGLEVYKEVHGELPVNVKLLVEGEEETGSRSFEELIDHYGSKLTADGCIWEGDGIDHGGRPKFVFGAKGLAYVELNYRGLNEDQHSMLAVVAPSPVWHMLEALNTLRDPDGNILIEGFYDDARPPTDDGLELLKRYYFQPTCNIAGIHAGFTVPGASKTVLPKEAMAKIDMRLVPDQDPHDIVEKLRAHLAKNGYGDIDITTFSMEHPVRSPADSLIGRASIEAAADVFDAPPLVQPLMIGTGPMYPVAATLGVPTVSPAGVCRPDSNIHAPNEHCLVEDFLATIEYTVAWLGRFATIDA